MASSISLEQIVQEMVESIKSQIPARSVRVANELRNAAMVVLSGARSGRAYGGHIASAPGEPPANRNGTFRKSWEPTTLPIGGGGSIARIESGLTVGSKKSYVLGELLEGGTSKMAPRPHHDRILQKAKPQAVRIYNEPYLGGFK